MRKSYLKCLLTGLFVIWASSASGGNPKYKFYNDKAASWTVSCSLGGKGSDSSSISSGGNWTYSYPTSVITNGTDMTMNCDGSSDVNSSASFKLKATVSTFDKSFTTAPYISSSSNVTVDVCAQSSTTYNIYIESTSSNVVTNESSVVLTWASTEDYTFIQGQRVADALAKRIARMWDDEEYTYSGNFDPTTQTFTISAKYNTSYVSDTSTSDSCA